MARPNGGQRIGTRASDKFRARGRQAGYKTPGANKPLFGLTRPGKKGGVGGQRPLSQSIQNGALRSKVKATPRTRRP